MNKRAFTLLEVLVVVAITSTLMTIMLPSLRRVREQARITMVNSDLYQIALGLEMYMNDHRGVHPPPRTDCWMGWDDCQLPPELVDFGYLPKPQSGSLMSTKMEDPFNRGVTYKYVAVGPYYQNRTLVTNRNMRLWVPLGFPAADGEPETDVRHDDPVTSPVTWVLYSMGPNPEQDESYEWDMISLLKGPVAKRSWYSPERKKGLLVRIRMRNGTHIGSFEGHP